MPPIFSGMVAADLTADLTFDELCRIAEEHSEPWESIAQCDVFLRAAGMLRHRTPEESEESGSRQRMRDILDMIQHCRKRKSVLRLSVTKPVSIVPTDVLQ